MRKSKDYERKRPHVGLRPEGRASSVPFLKKDLFALTCSRFHTYRIDREYTRRFNGLARRQAVLKREALQARWTATERP
jgi:hypothetical protein